MNSISADIIARRAAKAAATAVGAAFPKTGFLVFDTESVPDGKLIAQVKYPHDRLAPDTAIERARAEAARGVERWLRFSARYVSGSRRRLRPARGGRLHAARLGSPRRAALSHPRNRSSILAWGRPLHRSAARHLQRTWLRPSLNGTRRVRSRLFGPRLLLQQPQPLPGQAPGFDGLADELRCLPAGGRTEHDVATGGGRHTAWLREDGRGGRSSRTRCTGRGSCRRSTIIACSTRSILISSSCGRGVLIGELTGELEQTLCAKHAAGSAPRSRSYRRWRPTLRNGIACTRMPVNIAAFAQPAFGWPRNITRSCRLITTPGLPSARTPIV